MAEIPDDISKTALATLVAEFGDDEDRPVWMQRNEFVDVIARAIIAERERCKRDVEELIEQKASDARKAALEDAAKLLSVKGKKYHDDNPIGNVKSAWGRGVAAGLYDAAELLRALQGRMR